MNKILLLFSLLSLSIVGNAQQAPQLQTPFGNIDLSAMNDRSSLTRSSGNTFLGKEYVLLQFKKMPSLEEIKDLRTLGIYLLQYLPDNAYLASVSNSDIGWKKNSNLTYAGQLIHQVKTTPEIWDGTIPEWSQGSGGNALLMITYPKDINQDHIINELQTRKIEILSNNGFNSSLFISVEPSYIKELVGLPFITSVGLGPSPTRPDDIPGRALNRSNAIDTQLPGGRNYNGNGVGVLCRDDGEVFDHVDFHGRIFQEDSGPSRGSHGDGVSGIMAGSGNKDPRFRGMAAGSDLFVIDYQANFLDETMRIHFNDGVLVTNSSYSNGCNRGYTAISRTVDEQCFENPSLMHVFSAGNDGAFDCDYGAGATWGNVTGGHKQGKNVITVANTDPEGNIMASSSRGPANDGRIKPDIAANGAGHGSTDDDHTYIGFSGTSGAAPCIAGITAMLHTAYRENKNGEVADAALLKAIMLNTANDRGNAGPDYIYGWGIANALRAAKSIEDKRHLKETVAVGETNEHTISIPAGARELNVMVYWADDPASITADMALVNDLHTFIVDSQGDDHLPWLLDPTPDPVNLNTPATKGIDFLNNMEQITIKNPAEGDLTLSVLGARVPMGEHDYYVTWEIRNDEVEITYPIEGEKLRPNESVIARWDCVDTNEPIFLSLSLDGGSTFQDIGQYAPNATQANLSFPNALTNEAILRVTRAGKTFDSGQITIADIPKKLKLDQVCIDYAVFSWQALPGAISYDVYQLGDKYMEQVVTVTDTLAELPIISPFEENWFSVSANFDNDIKGRRAIAINSDGEGLLECVLDNDLSMNDVIAPENRQFITCDETADNTISIKFINEGLNPLTDILLSYQLNSEPVVSEIYPQAVLPGDTIEYTFVEPLDLEQSESVNIKTWTTHPSEQLFLNDTISFSSIVYQEKGLPVPYSEAFGAALTQGSIPDFWFSDNPDARVGWVPFASIQRDGTFGGMLTLPWENYNSRGEIDYLQLVPFDLSQNTGKLTFSFDLAYLFNLSDTDTLFLEVSNNCGESFDEVIWMASGSDMSTSNSPFQFPEKSTHWNNIELDVSQYAGSDKVMFRFAGINQSGNNLYLDNINLNNTELMDPEAAFVILNQVPCPNEEISIINNSTGGLLEHDWSFGIGAIPGSSIQSGHHEIFYLFPGEKSITLEVSNENGSSTISSDITIIDLPSGGYVAEEIGDGQFSFTSNSDQANSWVWDFGDGSTGNGKDVIHQYDELGTYDVNLTVSNPCGSRTFSRTIVVTTSSVSSISWLSEVSISPNPNSGQFSLSLNSQNSNEVDIRLLNATGLLIQSRNEKISQGENTIKFNESELPSGMYFILIESDNSYERLRVFVE